MVTLNFLLSAEGTAGNASADDSPPTCRRSQSGDGRARLRRRRRQRQRRRAASLVLSVSDPGIFAVAHGAEDLGFGADQASVRSVAVDSSADAPSDGRCRPT